MLATYMRRIHNNNLRNGLRAPLVACNYSPVLLLQIKVPGGVLLVNIVQLVNKYLDPVWRSIP